MSDQNKIYEFEEDFAGTLRCIPMSTRLKLDIAKVKVSLAQWDNMSIEQKKELLEGKCTDTDNQAYQKLAVKLIEESSHETPKELKSLDTSVWRDTSKVSPIVEAQIKKSNLPAISLEKWKSLTELQRFTLVKLADAEHEINYVPAMKEFGLMK